MHLVAAYAKKLVPAQIRRRSTDDARLTQAASVKAARWFARHDVRVVDVPTPEPAPDEALLRVVVAGICGTDVTEYLDGPIEIPTLAPHPLTGQMAPVTLGHEIVGEVVSNEAEGSGMLVMPDTMLGCGHLLVVRSLSSGPVRARRRPRAPSGRRSCAVRHREDGQSAPGTGGPDRRACCLCRTALLCSARGT